jgi:hypothetical protein
MEWAWLARSDVRPGRSDELLGASFELRGLSVASHGTWDGFPGVERSRIGAKAEPPGTHEALDGVFHTQGDARQALGGTLEAQGDARRALGGIEDAQASATCALGGTLGARVDATLALVGARDALLPGQDVRGSATLELPCAWGAHRSRRAAGESAKDALGCARSGVLDAKGAHGTRPIEPSGAPRRIAVASPERSLSVTEDAKRRWRAAAGTRRIRPRCRGCAPFRARVAATSRAPRSPRRARSPCR